MAHLSLSCLSGQEMIGTTGGLSIPTAEMNPSGTFMTGINFVGEGSIQGYDLTAQEDCWNFEYNTGIYYLNFTPFSWLEISLKNTMLKSRLDRYYHDKGDYYYERTDRSLSFRVKALDEGEYWPAVVLGINDPYQETGRGIYCSYYGVCTKHFHLKGLGLNLVPTIGYAQPYKHSKMYDGVFGSIKVSLDALSNCAILAEYDTHHFNLGLQTLLFNHLGIYAFTTGFQNFNCGIHYQYTIKY